MSRPDSRAVLHRLVEVLEDPAPINRGHAQHVRRLITGALASEAPPARGGGRPAAVVPLWSGSGAPEDLAAIAPEDPAEGNPAL